MSEVLNPDALKNLPQWEVNNNRLEKTYAFKDFYEVMAFVNAIAWLAHQENHHPDIHLSYRTCQVELTTHDAGGITQKDIALAQKIEALFR